MTTQSIARAKFAERKQFVIDAINRLTYADDTDEMTVDLIAVVRAVSGLMPTDDADAAVEEVADNLLHDMRVVDEDRDINAAMDRTPLFNAATDSWAVRS